MEELKVPLDEPYKTLATELMNDIFSTSQTSEDYWRQVLRPHAEKKFDFVITDKQDVDMKQLMKLPPQAGSSLFLMFLRFKKLTGIDFSSKEAKKIRSNSEEFFSQKVIFNSHNVKGIGQRVKHMSIVNVALGYIYKLQANASGISLEKKKDIMEKALECLEKGLESNPHNVGALKNAGSACFEIFNTKRFISNETVPPSRFDPLIDKALQYYGQSLRLDPENPDTLKSYGVFLGECGRKEEHLEYFIKYLKFDRTYDQLQQIIELLKGKPKSLALIKALAYEVGKQL